MKPRIISECAEGAHAECPQHCPRSPNCCQCECECHEIYRPYRPRRGDQMNPFLTGTD